MLFTIFVGVLAVVHSGFVEIATVEGTTDLRKNLYALDLVRSTGILQNVYVDILLNRRNLIVIRTFFRV